ERDLRALAGAPALAGLVHLGLPNCGLRAAEAAALVEGFRLPALVSLDLSDSSLGDEGVRVLAGDARVPGRGLLRVSAGAEGGRGPGVGGCWGRGGGGAWPPPRPWLAWSTWTCPVAAGPVRRRWRRRPSWRGCPRWCWTAAGSATAARRPWPVPPS